jgi:excisionase family DNA binding protein
LAVPLTSHHLTATPTTDFALIEPLIDVRRAAKLLGISEKTLRDWVWRKKIDYVKVGDRVMFEPEAIREFIARNRVSANQRVI